MNISGSQGAALAEFKREERPRKPAEQTEPCHEFTSLGGGDGGRGGCVDVPDMLRVSDRSYANAAGFRSGATRLEAVQTWRNTRAKASPLFLLAATLTFNCLGLKLTEQAAGLKCSCF